MALIVVKVLGVFLVFALACAGAAAISLLMAFPVKWCWNYAITTTFAAPAITWGQAWCLTFLSGMLLASAKA